MSDGIYHVPVLVDEVVECFSASSGTVVIDCTVGDGGHSMEILEKLQHKVIIGIDVDPEAVLTSANRLSQRYPGRFHARRGDYREMRRLLAQMGLPRVSGFLFDLGVSSRQLDEPWRGFTYRADAPLDMRMNPGNPVTARDILHNSSEEELERILREYGEERFARRIAAGIVRRRSEGRLETSGDLVEVVLESIPAWARKGTVHPARRTFQALRIRVNDEIDRLLPALEDAFDLLQPGGVIAVISYHSLEDRIVKRLFVRLEEAERGKRLFTKAITPSQAEIERNPRSRSAKLRAIRRGDLV